MLMKLQKIKCVITNNIILIKGYIVGFNNSYYIFCFILQRKI